jgi:hypothetical protein
MKPSPFDVVRVPALRQWDARTDHEAARTWCPFSRSYRAPVGGAAGVNRGWHHAMPSEVACLGSGCSAWRTIDPPLEVETRHRALPAPEGEGWVNEGPDLRDPGYVRWARPATKPRRGYCGLAVG